MKKWFWPTWEQRKRMLRIDVVVAVIVLYCALILSYVPLPSNWVETAVGSRWDYVTFFVRTFQFHFGLLMVLIAAVALLMRWWYWAAAAVPFILFTAGPAALSYLPRVNVKQSGTPINVVTCNLLYINPQIHALSEKIAALDADIVCIQELTPKLEPIVRNALGDGYRHVATIPQLDAFGVGVYSRHPFAGPPGEAIPNRDMVPQQRIKLNVKGTTMTLYNIHLYPPGSYLDYIDMRWQLDELVKAVQREEGPLMLVGDFNFPRRTRQSALLEQQGLRDAYASAGIGRGSTWPALRPLNVFPGMALDHIFMSDHFRCEKIQVLTAPGSDHHMMYAQLRLTAVAGGD